MKSIATYKLVLVSFCISVILSCICYQIVLFPTDNHTINIVPVFSADETIGVDEEIVITDIIINGNRYGINRQMSSYDRSPNLLLETTEGWMHRDNVLVTKRSHFTKNLKLEFKNVSTIGFVFKESPWSCQVDVQYGENVETIDLYNKLPSQTTHMLKTNNHSMLSKLTTFFLLYIIICISIYLLLKQIVQRLPKLDAFIQNKPVWVWVNFLCIIAIRFLCYSNVEFVRLYPDSSAMYMRPDIVLNFFSSGEIPTTVIGYTLLIRIVQLIFGDVFYLHAVVYIQIVVSLISSYFFYKTILVLTKRPVFSSIICLLFSSSIAIFGWDNCILTESLSISGTIFYVFFITSYIKNNQPTML